MTNYSQAQEDYLEALYIIARDHKVARVKDVAQLLGVTRPSVVSAVRSMAEKGLVRQEKYGYIELTADGLAVAEDVYARHQILLAFFQDVLALDPSTAERDACRLEHHLSAEARERLLQFISFVSGCPQGQSKFLSRFQDFISDGNRGPCPGCKCFSENC